MRHTIKLPKMGDTTDSVVVLEWMVESGQAVESGNTLLRVETDKIDADVPSPITGVVAEQLVAVGEEVATGDHIVVITT